MLQVLQAGKTHRSHARPRSHISCSSGSSGAGGAPPSPTPGLCQPGVLQALAQALTIGSGESGPRMSPNPARPRCRPHAAVGIPIDLAFYSDLNSPFLPSCLLAHHVRRFAVIFQAVLSSGNPFPSARALLRRPKPRSRLAATTWKLPPLLHPAAIDVARFGPPHESARDQPRRTLLAGNLTLAPPPEPN
jgi:hypothetical protein